MNQIILDIYIIQSIYLFHLHFSSTLFPLNSIKTKKKEKKQFKFINENIKPKFYNILLIKN